MSKCYLIIAFCLLYLSSMATLLHVSENYLTINDALNVLLCGDTILVQPGTYVENLTIESKTFTLASLYLTTQDTSYISTTIIDGGGIFCQSANVFLSHIVIEDNYAGLENGTTCLLEDWQTTGKHELMWNGKDDNNRNAGSGIYFINVMTSSSSSTSKVLLLK